MKYPEQLKIQLSNISGEYDLETEIKWCIDWLAMELDDQSDDEENLKYIKSIKKQIKQCKDILLKL